MCRGIYLLAFIWFAAWVIGQTVVIYTLDKNILSKKLPDTWIQVFKKHTQSPRSYSRAFNDGLYEDIKRLSSEIILKLK
ncbi:hypothetical protein BpHYR1_011000 [Brachionus plicatilis]|uniref:Uncharacterized protein n=1 Tax=Brachionus plicatilis TaxID=10195 RepID=A0A3M7PR22_BRAPC|nr:hypothetical protein BpHYR1_011000 [Brachionus plicatilis]